MLPGNAVFRSERRFVDFGRRRTRAYAAEEDSVDFEGVGAAEGGSYVEGAAYVVQYQDYA